MPAPVAPAEKRTPLLTVLFWIGVALAPLAALILLVADGNGALRFGAVLAILAVVLIGLSIALRPEGGGTAEAEELREEIEQLRRELRGEVVAAAQRGNQALDQARRTEESVTVLRRRLDAAAAGIAAAAGLTTGAADEPAGARARVPAPEPYDDRYEQPDQGGTGWGQPAARRGEDESGRRSQPGTRYGSERSAQPGGTDRPQSGVYGAPRTPEPDVRPEPGHRQVGVVHHTETVHVTTRHTIVDGGADPAAAGRYGGYAGRWSPEERGFGGAEPEERPRSGYRDADDDRHRSGVDRGPAQGADRGDRSWAGQGAGREDRSWDGPGAGREDRSWDGQGAGREDRSWGGQGTGRDDRSWDGQGAGRDDRSWAGQGASGAEWGRPGQGRPREDEDRSFDGPGAPAPEHSWTGARSAGDDRGWSAGPGEQRSWSPEGRAEEIPWAGSGDDRSWSAGWDGAGRDDVARDGTGGNEAGRTGGWASAYARAWAPAEASGPVDSGDTDGDYWSELRSGNRWAAVRDDEHGREVRVGERRAALHADGGGTEYRVEDRWAAVREPRRDQGGVHGGAAGESRRGQGGVYGASWAEESRPALPAGGVPVPDEWRPPTQRSGQPEWRQVDPEPVRYGDERYGYPPRDDAPRAGGTRSADRWR
ncbi:MULTISPECIES: hypothetical protein [Micromonospora]|uniref:hypothetical protein n=1 Tax=Micromonospora TaxID=1873 RepID=UPI0018F74C12|nr:MULTISPECIES: hypothetical protein [Micromonospora]